MEVGASATKLMASMESRAAESGGLDMHALLQMGRAAFGQRGADRDETIGRGDWVARGAGGAGGNRGATSMPPASQMMLAQLSKARQLQQHATNDLSPSPTSSSLPPNQDEPVPPANSSHSTADADATITSTCPCCATAARAAAAAQAETALLSQSVSRMEAKLDMLLSGLKMLPGFC